MANPADRVYRFSAAAHWAAGAMSGFDPDGDTLVLTPPLAAGRVEGSQRDSLAAIDACGRLAWLRTATGELVRLYDFGPEVQGRLDVEAPRALFVGPTRIWVEQEGRVRRFDARTLQLLGEFGHSGLIAAASDGCDGLWLLIRSRRGAYVRHIDGRGCTARTRLHLLCAVRPVALAAARDGRWLAVLDSPAEARAVTAAEWRLHIVDLEVCRTAKPLCFKLADREPPPRYLVIDPRGRVHLAGTSAGALLLGVSKEGEEIFRQPLRLKPPAWPVAGLLWQDGIVVAAADGLYRLAPGEAEDRDTATASAVFVTPTLISPDGTPSGWNRADIDVLMPEEATLKVSVGTIDAADLEAVRYAYESTRRRAAARLAEVDRRIRWNEERTRTYRGGGGKRVLRFLLDQLPDTHLWLKLEFECPAGAAPVSLLGLRVRYPDRSWLDSLPALYRENEGSAAQLRRFLAPMEALYGDLDETIDSLPARIDPATASDEWLPWLLGWLGFPPTGGLDPDVQRLLLREAGTLLAARGTQAALERMLDIVTGGRAHVRDSAASAAFWILSSRRTRLTARLGCDTRVVAQRPADFVLGRKDLRLGEAPLGRSCTDIDSILCAACGLVTVDIELDADRRRLVEPIVRSLLDMFVPAHCRLELRIWPAARALPAGRLDSRWTLDGGGGASPGGRLDDPSAIELGRITRTGAWRLPATQPLPFPLDETAAPDGVRRLA